ncbi:hypothetical protein HY745_04680 [Candidatus Desantisbacteria bacterium]|nr:hypothetical protein [Candidatus Desantisbacteria bacterium]
MIFNKEEIKTILPQREPFLFIDEIIEINGKKKKKNKPEIAKTNPYYYLCKVKSEFLVPVIPGNKLILEANIVKIIDSAGIVDTFARVGDKTAAKATLEFGVRKK